MPTTAEECWTSSCKPGPEALTPRPITVREDPAGPVRTLIAPVDQIDEVGPALARGGLRNTWLPP